MVESYRTQFGASSFLAAATLACVFLFRGHVLFLLAAGSVYWNESAHYLIYLYLALGLVFAVLGIRPTCAARIGE